MDCRFGAMVVLLIGQASFAQQAVQQPVVGVTSVITSVSVPDRGGAFLGGMSSAQSARSQYGPFPSGTSTGFTRQSSSMSAHVQIIDLQAMDQEILHSQATTTPRLTGQPRENRPRKAVEPNRIPEPADVVSAAAKVARHEELAQSAEAAGRMVVARLHWQTAAKYGSKIAENRLAELAQSSTVPTAKPAFR